MNIHSQNLNETGGKVIGSMFWRGRAWLRGARYRELLHVEWLFGKYARGFAVTASVGYGDSDSGVCLHVCLPWLFSIYLVIPHLYRCKERKSGVAIHNGSFWIYPFVDAMESHRDQAWWDKCYSWAFPWSLDWYSTEVLRPLFGVPSADWPVVWSENKGNRLPAFEGMREREVAEQSVTQSHGYTYKLKRGAVQSVVASIYVNRMTWRARWWPVIWRRKVSTSICVRFSAEVGEKTGSWKGGCTGCGYDLKPGEMPLDCLRRMERERKFDR